MHAHISYVGSTETTDGGSGVGGVIPNGACLLLLTVDRHAFYELSEMRKRFAEKLLRGKLLAPLIEACKGAKAIRLSEVSYCFKWKKAASRKTERS